MSISKKREELAAKQSALGGIFTEARTDSGELDLDRIKSLGDLSTIAKAEKIRAMNAELDAIGTEIDSLEAVEKAAKAQADRESSRGSIRHPGGDERAYSGPQKSLGEMVTSHPDYVRWSKSGGAGGITLQLDGVMPSDLLVASGGNNTMHAKMMTTAAGWAPERIRIGEMVEAATRPIQVLDIMPLSRTVGDSVVYMEETTRTHGGVEVLEGALYGSSTFVLTERTSLVRKIAESIPVTDEQLEDVAQVESYLNTRLMFGVRQRLDSQVLVGNATAPNLRGLLNTVGIQTTARGVGPPLEPIPVAIFRAMDLVRSVGHAEPTHVVMHSTNWSAVRTERDTNGNWLWGHPSQPGPDRLFGLPVVLSQAGAAGTAFVGSFSPQWVTLAERRGVDVQVGYIGDQFAQGRRTMRADGRWAFVVFRPAAFCTVTGL